MNTKVSIVVSEDQFDQVVEQLEGKGFRIERKLRAIGAITGDLGDMDIATIGSLEGVQAVEHQGEFHLPTSSDPIQ